MFKGQGISYRHASFEELSDDEAAGCSSVGTSEHLNLAVRGTRVALNRCKDVTADSETVRDDCCCSPRFFTNRCAVIGTIVTLLVVTLFVLVLDLGINEAELIAHLRPYKYDRFDGNKTLVRFELRGTAETFAKFETISWDDRKQLYAIDLERVEVDVSKLVATFSDSGVLSNLKNLTMKDVRFKGVMPWDELNRVGVPPAFQNLRIDISDGSVGREVGFTLDLCDQCVNIGPIFNYTILKPRNCLDSFLFFRKPSGWTGNLAELGYNFFFSVGGYTFVKLNNVTGVVTSTLPYSDELIRNVTRSERFSGIKSLHLNEAKLNASTFVSLSPTLKVLNVNHLVLEGFQGKRISSLLTNFSQLEELVLAPSHLENRSDYEVILDDLPRTLKSLTLAHVRLRVNPNSTINFHLENVGFYQVEIVDDDIITNFSKYFNARHVSWRLDDFNGTGTFWTTVLEGVTKANPDTLFLDNWKPLAYSDILGTGKVFDTLVALRTNLRVSAVRRPIAMTFRKTKRYETFLQNYGHFNTSEENSSRIWFKLLKLDEFLDSRYLSVNPFSN